MNKRFRVGDKVVAICDGADYRGGEPLVSEHLKRYDYAEGCKGVVTNADVLSIDVDFGGIKKFMCSVVKFKLLERNAESSKTLTTWARRGK